MIVCRLAHINCQPACTRCRTQFKIIYIINFDCDRVLFSIQNPLLRTRITFCVVCVAVVVVAVEFVSLLFFFFWFQNCMHRIHMAIIIMCVSCYYYWCLDAFKRLRFIHSFTFIFVYSNFGVYFISIGFGSQLWCLSVISIRFFDSISLLLCWLSDTLNFKEVIFLSRVNALCHNKMWIILGSSSSQKQFVFNVFILKFFWYQAIVCGPLIITIACSIAFHLCHLSCRILNAFQLWLCSFPILSPFRSYDRMRIKIFQNEMLRRQFSMDIK